MAKYAALIQTAIQRPQDKYYPALNVCISLPSGENVESNTECRTIRTDNNRWYINPVSSWNLVLELIHMVNLVYTATALPLQVDPQTDA